MQSGLPPTELAQIWSLSDLNRDGCMNAKEFSIAMYLIQKKLQGFAVPSALPPGLLVEPSAAVSGPLYSAPAPMPAYGGLPSPTAAAPPPPRSALPSGGFDWAMSESSKIKYGQQFNQIDKQRIGRLSGVQARNILASSGLPMETLAKVWQLSDYDKDGQLTIDEFRIAMHLIDVAKTGRALPNTLPNELISGRARSIVTSPDDDEIRPAQSAFDDKRKENYERGAAELERRRQALLEEERLIREERERREREEYERRERERQVRKASYLTNNSFQSPTGGRTTSGARVRA